MSNLKWVYLFSIPVIIVAVYLSFWQSPSGKQLKGCNNATSTSCEELERIANTPPVTIPTIPPIIATTSGNPSKSGQIDEHLFVDNALREVNFCGNKYLVKQIILDGVDIIQHIAYMATTKQLATRGDGFDYATSICSGVETNNSNNFIYESKSGSRIEIDMHAEVKTWVNQAGHRFYELVASGLVLDIDITDGSIYLSGGFSGELSGPVGKIK